MIHIRRSRNKQFYFTVNASNGNVLCTSETYKTKRSCKKGIASVGKALIKDDIKDHTKKEKTK